MEADDSPPPTPDSLPEPEKYFKADSKQWWSAKRGEWIDPALEIKMDVMKPAKIENEEGQEILDETNQFIEKLDAVERDRKESQESQMSVSPNVNIIVHQASVIEEPEEEYDYKVNDETCSLAGAEDKTPEQYYQENMPGLLR